MLYICAIIGKFAPQPLLLVLISLARLFYAIMLCASTSEMPSADITQRKMSLSRYQRKGVSESVAPTWPALNSGVKHQGCLVSDQSVPMAFR